jgi:hypothetical protein
MPPDVTEVSMNVFGEDISLFLLRLFWEEQTGDIPENNLGRLTLRQLFCP